MTALRQWLGSGLLWGAVAAGLLTFALLGPMGGRHYYATPLTVRAYDPMHRLLRPSGPIGQSLGVLGTVLLLVPFAYMARKRWLRRRNVGAVSAWLELHLFCGIVGPVLVTFHTSFKFNGIISAAYWSMVTVMVSGFIGRYLYVRIPRSIRGVELSRAELDDQAATLHDAIATSAVDAQVMREVDTFEREADLSPKRLSWVDLTVGEVRLRRRVRALADRLATLGVAPTLTADIVRLTGERSLLLRRAAYLQRTKSLFALWHVFHLPLVYLLLLIATAHVGLALYLGYVPFRW